MCANARARACIFICTYTDTQIMVGKAGGRGTRQLDTLSLPLGSREWIENGTKAKRPQGPCPVTQFSQLDSHLKASQQWGPSVQVHEPTKAVWHLNHNRLRGAQASALSQNCLASSSLYFKHIKLLLARVSLYWYFLLSYYYFPIREAFAGSHCPRCGSGSSRSPACHQVSLLSC